MTPHRRAATKAFGRLLPKGVFVHHIDYDRSNNENTNLVVCQNSSYHKLIHRRTDAFRATGHVHWLKCCYCKKYDHPTQIEKHKGNGLYHIECKREHSRKWWQQERDRYNFAKKVKNKLDKQYVKI